jgi:hypothetical protein
MRISVMTILLALSLTIVPTSAQPGRGVAYRVVTGGASLVDLRRQFTPDQLGVLEKLNRADLRHLERLPVLVVPEHWASDDLDYSVFPFRYSSAARVEKLIVVSLAGQAFGAYESGTLVRWGPTSSGRATGPTPVGLFFLTWKAQIHLSTIDPDWVMPWTFNFESRQGLAFHQYALPGVPASHGCLRLLERDAEWLFNWGEAWALDRSGPRPGTPVLIFGTYDFGSLPPWRSLEWLAQPLELPAYPGPPDP